MHRRILHNSTLQSLLCAQSCYHILILTIESKATLPSLIFNIVTGTSTLNASSPGRFMGAEKPATRDIEVEQMGHFHSLGAPAPAPDCASRRLMQTLQYWWLQGRTLKVLFSTRPLYPMLGEKLHTCSHTISPHMFHISWALGDWRSCWNCHQCPSSYPLR